MGRAIRNETDVKDLMQEIAIGFLKVPRETVVKDPARYLFAIAHSVMNQFFRKKGASPVVYDSEAADQLLAGSEDFGICDAESEIVQWDLRSDYCYAHEMTRAMRLAENGKLLVVPIILKDCDWLVSPLRNFKTLPRDRKPIAAWDDPNDAFDEVAAGLRRLLDDKSADCLA